MTLSNLQNSPFFYVNVILICPGVAWYVGQSILAFNISNKVLYYYSMENNILIKSWTLTRCIFLTIFTMKCSSAFHMCTNVKKNFYAALLLRKENEKSKINACLCEISYIFYEELSIYHIQNGEFFRLRHLHSAYSCLDILYCQRTSVT